MSFRRAGAGLDAAAKARLAEIVERLAALGTDVSARTCWPTSNPRRSSSKPRTTSPACRISCARRPREEAQERGLAGKHAITLSRSSVEPFLQSSLPPRPAREGVPRLDRARRQRRGDRQQGADRRDGGAARRARPAPRLSDLRRLSARRRHGEDAGGGARPACNRCGRRRASARSPTATPCRNSSAPRAAISSSRPGTGATTPRSCARRAAISTKPSSSPICRSTA